jgi:hypothetical protein
LIAIKNNLYTLLYLKMILNGTFLNEVFFLKNINIPFRVKSEKSKQVCCESAKSLLKIECSFPLKLSSRLRFCLFSVSILIGIML